MGNEKVLAGVLVYYILSYCRKKTPQKIAPGMLARLPSNDLYYDIKESLENSHNWLQLSF